jgi:hypothetical protein
MTSESPDWEPVTLAGFALELSYPSVTPRGQGVERAEEQVDDHRGDMHRIHLSSPDRSELYVEVARFRGITPEEEYSSHRPHLLRRFGDGSVTDLGATSFLDRQAWSYAFRWDEEGRPMERSALLLDVGGDTYRVIYDPRSQLNHDVIATIAIAPS